MELAGGGTAACGFLGLLVCVGAGLGKGWGLFASFWNALIRGLRVCLMWVDGARGFWVSRFVEGVDVGFERRWV